MSELEQMFYTGVGSRRTPPYIVKMMFDIGAELAKRRIFTLRSGHAEGADRAFESGCDRNRGSKEIYLPWQDFEYSNSLLFGVGPRALALAEMFHPAWDKLSDGAKKLHGRNAYQVLGSNLDKPSDFLVCWTKDGCMSHETRTVETGGTGTAISIAFQYKVPIYNLASFTSREEFCKNLNYPMDLLGLEEEEAHGAPNS